MASWVELRVLIPRTQLAQYSAVAFAHQATGTQEAPAPGDPQVFQQPWDKTAPPLSTHCSFRSWFSPQDSGPALQALQALGGEVEQLEVRDEDWAESWKQHHKRVEISPRLAVSPEWHALPGDLVIPPGNAFGTGDHPTTLACLGAIDRLSDEVRTCLDVGCGSGVLALAAVKLGALATGIDIDPDAVRTAQANAALNGLQATFSTAPLQRVQGSYDLVVANVFAEVLVGMAPELLRVTGRHLILAGVMASKADSVLDVLSPPLAVRDTIGSGDWVSIHLQKLP